MKLSTTDRFEIKARAFRADTGCFPPGKDCPAALNRSDERMEADKSVWNVWIQAHGHIIDRVLDAVERYTEETEE